MCHKVIKLSDLSHMMRQWFYMYLLMLSQICLFALKVRCHSNYFIWLPILSSCHQ